MSKEFSWDDIDRDTSKEFSWDEIPTVAQAIDRDPIEPQALPKVEFTLFPTDVTSVVLNDDKCRIEEIIDHTPLGPIRSIYCTNEGSKEECNSNSSSSVTRDSNSNGYGQETNRLGKHVTFAAHEHGYVERGRSHVSKAGLGGGLGER